MWLPTLFAERRRRLITSRKPASTTLSLERLEDRAVPANFTAANASDLIAAINMANLTFEADTITLAAGKTFALTAVDNTTDGPTGLPVIAAGGGKLTITGNGAVIERNTATGTPPFRLFDVAAGASLTLENLTLQGGLAFGFGLWAQGGAVYNQGALMLHGVTVQNNPAQGNNGIRIFNSNTPGGSAFGGALYSNGTLTMDDCTIRNNVATGGRGADGFLAPPSMPGDSTGIRVRGSDGGSAYGGGLHVAGGAATIRSSPVESNIAQGGAGGAGYKGSGNGSKGPGVGGGIFIDPDALAFLDAFTISHVKKNRASSSDPNIYGSYDTVP